MITSLQSEFVTQVSEQYIFQTFVDNSVGDDGTSIAYNKLVCKDNREIYFANRNCIRYSNVDPKNPNFHILSNPYDKFNIVALEMNNLGTLLASIGEEDLVILSIPSNLQSGLGSTVSTKAHKLRNIGGKIRKVVWQTVAANDSVVVVLNDRSQIKAYDISVSLDVPVISVDLTLFKQFGNDNALSISFGSLNNLSGALTLYVSTEKSHIYAVYPFLHRSARIATTATAVSDALADTSALISEIEARFPSLNMADTLDSKLMTAAVKQFGFYSHLQKQASTFTFKEVRGVGTTSLYELVVFDNSLPVDYEPVLQGPLDSGTAPVSDIFHISSNNDLSIIASLSSSPDKNVLIRYHAQLRPLLMHWNDGDDTPNLPSKPVVKPRGYAKPRRGFGFVDLSESPEESEEARNEKLAQDRRIKENEFWKNETTVLSTLSRDELPTISEKVFARVFNAELSKFAVISPQNIIFVDPRAWVDSILTGLQLDEETFAEASKTYISASSRTEKVLGTIVVADELTQTGDVLVVFRNGSQDNLEVIELKPALAEEGKLTKEKQEDKAVEVGFVQGPLSCKEPIEELIRSATLLPVESALKLLPSGTPKTEMDILEALNKLSSATIEQVARCTSFAIQLNIRMGSEVEVMKAQIQSLNKILEKNIDNSGLVKNSERIAETLRKQKALDNRIENLKSKLMESIQKWRANKSLPISVSEKNWFKEINSVNIEINKDSEERKSLISTVVGLQSQVRSLVEDIRNQKLTDESASTKVKNMELRQQLSKVKYWLEQEEPIIASSRYQLVESLKKLAI